jgi:sigma-B regulation protein RsbU (phosphoserine phosphatase)
MFLKFFSTLKQVIFLHDLDKDSLSISSRRKLYLTQLLCVTFFLISSSYWFIFGLFGLALAQLFVPPIVLNYFIAGILNKKGWSSISKFLIIAGTSASLFSFSVLLGKGSGAHLIFFALVGLPLILFETNQRTLITITTLIPVSLALILEFTHYSLFFPSQPITQELTIYIYPIAILTCAIMIFLSILFYFLLHSEYEKELIKSTETALAHANHALQEKHRAEKAANDIALLLDQQIKLVEKKELLLYDIKEREKQNFDLMMQEKVLRKEAQESAAREHNLLIKTQKQAMELEKKLLLEKDIIRGGQVQQLLLPKIKPEGIGLEVVYQPARILSGDLWYWHYIGKNRSKIFIIAVDIQGKGVGAALPTVAFASLIREFLSAKATKIETLRPLLSFIQDKIMTTDAFTRKAAACVAYLIDPKTETIEYCNAGMEEVVTFVHDGQMEILPCLCSAFGFEEDPIPIKKFGYKTGDRLLLSSDGLKDTVNPKGEYYGEERTNVLVSNALHKPTEEVLPHIFNTIKTYQSDAEQTDDRTVILVEFM